MKYIFYDTETTGLSPEFDQILQFAALEADEDLNELDSINIRCRILPYIVPSPRALLVTNVSPRDLVSSNHSHLQMIYAIREWAIKKCPAMFVGHNSMKFDESFLRHAFYKTLHPVYLTNTQGNARADTMRIAQALAIFTPGSITVPLSDKGKPTFKLGMLARANGIDFKEEDAHDALADVRATLQLAKFMRAKAPEIWEQMLSNGIKKNALAFMYNNPAFCLADVNFGNYSTYVVSAIANNPNYDAEMAVFDLKYDPATYLNCSTDELVEIIKGKDKPIRIVTANNQPMIVDTAIGHEIVETYSIPEPELNRRVQLIKSATDFKDRIALALTKRYEPEEASKYVEEAIYQGFPPRTDEAVMINFHRAGAEEKSVHISRISDSRYREMALRLMLCEYSEHMDAEQKLRIEKMFQERLLTEEKVPWLTIPAALKKIEELKEVGEKLELLAEIEVFIKELEKTLYETA